MKIILNEIKLRAATPLQSGEACEAQPHENSTKQTDPSQVECVCPLSQPQQAAGIML